MVYRYSINPLTPNDHYSGRTAPLTSKRCILYIYSTNIGTEYIKHVIYSPSFSLQNAVCFTIPNIFCSCIIHILYTGRAKIKKNNSGTKRLTSPSSAFYGDESPGSRLIKRSKTKSSVVATHESTADPRTSTAVTLNATVWPEKTKGARQPNFCSNGTQLASYSEV